MGPTLNGCFLAIPFPSFWLHSDGPMPCSRWPWNYNVRKAERTGWWTEIKNQRCINKKKKRLWSQASRPPWPTLRPLSEPILEPSHPWDGHGCWKRIWERKKRRSEPVLISQKLSICSLSIFAHWKRKKKKKGQCMWQRFFHCPSLLSTSLAPLAFSVE